MLNRYKIMMPVGIFFFCTISIWTEDSVPTFHYDTQHTGQTEALGPDQPELLWSFRTQASLTASPVIAPDGTLYVASTDGTLYALEKNGNVKWTYKTAESLFGTPAIAPDGNILIGDLAGKYYAIDSQGKEKWIFQIPQGKEKRIVCSPVVASDGQSYIGGWNEQFYAIQPDGASRWKTDLNGYISSAPVLDGEGNVYVAVNESAKLKLHKFKPSSSTNQWTFEENIQESENRVISSPAIDVANNRLYIGVCSTTGLMFSVNLNTGRRAWSKRMDQGIVSSPAIGKDGTIYVGCLDGQLYAFEPEVGANRWTFSVDGYFIIGSPSIDGNGVIYVGDSDGILYAVSPEGKELWRWSTSNSIESAPVIASDGTLYITSTDSVLYALKNPTAVRDWRTF